MRLTEEQVRERLEGAAHRGTATEKIMHDPRHHIGALAIVGVRWTGEHYEEVDDG